jgi:hypothetical protein
VDDNARALLLACALNNPGEQRLPEVLTARFAAFVQHAWNPDTRRFRNFMGFNRTWLEDRGSEDSHGRTLWALGKCAHRDASPSRRRWAAALFAEALSTAEAFSSPRAWAFTLLGLGAYCAVAPDNLHARDVRHFLAGKLMSILASAETPEWVWFEEGLTYDNARLPQALIMTGMATQTPVYVDAGLRSLHWLMIQQTSSAGHFRPIGDNRRLPHGVAGGRRCRMERGRDAGFCMVSRQQRSVPGAGRSPHRKLPRWIAPRSCQRKLRRRVGRILSPWSRGDSSAGTRQHRSDKTHGTARRGSLNFTSHSSEPRALCQKPPS